MPVRTLSPELAKKAEIELNEDPKRLEDGLAHLKEWAERQPHINARIDDQWLLVFLRGCKYSLERTKKKLDLYYTLRSTESGLFNTMPNKELFNEIMDFGPILFLNNSGPAEPVVGLYRGGTCDPQKYDLITIIKCMMLLQKILLIENDNVVVAGLKLINDLNNCTLAHFLQMNPTMMKKMSVFMQEAAPIRVKSNHFINTFPGFEAIFNLFKGLLNEKNQSRLFVHNQNEELYKHVPREILPNEYGGKAGPIKDVIDYWKKKADEYWPWLEDDLKYKTDESKRPGKPRTAEDVFGIDGSFRQLEFD